MEEVYGESKKHVTHRPIVTETGPSHFRLYCVLLSNIYMCTSTKVKIIIRDRNPT